MTDDNVIIHRPSTADLMDFRAIMALRGVDVSPALKMAHKRARNGEDFELALIDALELSRIAAWTDKRGNVDPKMPERPTHIWDWI